MNEEAPFDEPVDAAIRAAYLKPSPMNAVEIASLVKNMFGIELGVERIKARLASLPPHLVGYYQGA